MAQDVVVTDPGHAGTETLGGSSSNNALHLATEVPQNWTPDGYAHLLKAHGPLWTGTAIFTAARPIGMCECSEASQAMVPSTARPLRSSIRMEAGITKTALRILQKS
jgi:hypothetical protein